MITSTGALRIGGNAIWGEWFQGRIDEVRVYRRALSADRDPGRHDDARSCRPTTQRAERADRT